MKRSIKHISFANICIIMLLCAVSCFNKQQRVFGIYAGPQDVYDHMTTVKDDNEKESIKKYVCDSLDFSELGELPIWESFMEEWINLFKQGETQQFSETEFTYTTKMLLSRVLIDSPDKVKPLIHSLATILIEQDRKKVAACIAAYSQGVNVTVDEDSEIATRLLTMVTLPGTKAPSINGVNLIGEDLLTDKSLIIFYGSNCPECESLLSEVTKKYIQLLGKGVRIISISSDSDKESYNRYASEFPWPDKLCDYKSYSGENFKNYGVAAVPVMYLVDSDGMVVDQYNTLKETNLLKSEDEVGSIYNDKRVVH